MTVCFEKPNNICVIQSYTARFPHQIMSYCGVFFVVMWYCLKPEQTAAQWRKKFGPWLLNNFVFLQVTTKTCFSWAKRTDSFLFLTFFGVWWQVSLFGYRKLMLSSISVLIKIWMPFFKQISCIIAFKPCFKTYLLFTCNFPKLCFFVTAGYLTKLMDPKSNSL